jgi:hypothetical protein
MSSERTEVGEINVGAADDDADGRNLEDVHDTDGKSTTLLHETVMTLMIKVDQLAVICRNGRQRE